MQISCSYLGFVQAEVIVKGNEKREKAEICGKINCSDRIENKSHG